MGDLQTGAEPIQFFSGWRPRAADMEKLNCSGCQGNSIFSTHPCRRVELDKIELEAPQLDSTPITYYSVITFKMSTFLEHLNAMREQLDVAIAAAKADGSGDKPMPIAAAGKSKGKAPKADKPAKKERANAGQPTAWAEFSNLKRLEHKDTVDAWVAERLAAAKAGTLFYGETDAAVKAGRAKAGDPIPENKVKVGAHLTWVSLNYKGEDQTEWKAFEAAWKEAHPKGSRAASVADDASDAGSADGSDSAQEKPATAGKKRGAKKYADMTPEELEAAKAKRAAKKAAKGEKKAASEAEDRQSACMEPASPVAAPSAAVGGGGSVAAAAPAAETEDEEVTDSLISFTLKKTKYLRFGHRDENGAPVWDADGDIWLQAADGGKGAYAGKLKADGSIDNSPEVLDDEPELE